MSLMVAPIPVMKPYHRPLFKVRWIQSTPTGPNGADTTTPMMMPFQSMLSMVSKVIMGAKIVQKNEYVNNKWAYYCSSTSVLFLKILYPMSAIAILMRGLMMLKKQ